MRPARASPCTARQTKTALQSEKSLGAKPGRISDRVFHHYVVLDKMFMTEQSFWTASPHGRKPQSALDCALARPATAPSESLRGGKPSHELLATQQAARRTLTASFT
jgi:hypothetical protein